MPFDYITVLFRMKEKKREIQFWDNFGSTNPTLVLVQIKDEG